MSAETDAENTVAQGQERAAKIKAVWEEPPHAGRRGQSDEGLVTMTLGADGWPASVGVADDWVNKRLDFVEGAVKQAFLAAKHENLSHRVADARPAGVPPRHVPGRPTRTLDDLIAQVAPMLNRVKDHQWPTQSLIGAPATSGPVTVRLSIGGIEECRIDPQWQPPAPAGQALGTAVKQAVDRAKHSVPAVTMTAGLLGELDNLINDAMAHLNAVVSSAPMAYNEVTVAEVEAHRTREEAT